MKVQRPVRENVGECLPETVCINFYVLIDPRDGKIRYVGQTVDTQNRLRNHIWEAKKKNRSHKERWIVSLLRRNMKPVMKVLWSGVLKLSEINLIESKVIKHFSKSYKLTNAIDRARNVSVIITKPVYQFDMQGKFIKKFMNANQAELQTGVNNAGILSVCSNPSGRGNRSRGGFLWSYDHICPKLLDPNYRVVISEKQTYQYDLSGVLIAVFKSARKASKSTGVCWKRISACLNGRQKTAGGFVWKINEDMV